MLSLLDRLDDRGIVQYTEKLLDRLFLVRPARLQVLSKDCLRPPLDRRISSNSFGFAPMDGTQEACLRFKVQQAIKVELSDQIGERNGRTSGNRHRQKCRREGGRKLWPNRWDVQAQAKGQAKQLQGAAEDLYGQAVDAAGGVVDTVQNVIETRPYTAVAVALGLGWLLGRMHRPL